MNKDRGFDGPAEDSVEALFRAAYGRLLNGAVRRGLHLQEAEDAVQETFVAVLARQATAHKDGKPADLRAWTWGTLRHKIADALQGNPLHSAERLGKLLDDKREVPSPESDLADREERERQCAHLGEALERLRGSGDSINFCIVIMLYMEGLSLKEVAEALGLRPDRVQDRLRRALDWLYEDLAGDSGQASKQGAKRRRKKT